MAGRKPTGVYTKVTKVPVTASTAVPVTPLVYMRTKKGSIISRVSATNFKEVLGFDPVFNPAYASLARLLELSDSVYVVRLQKDAALANALVSSTGVVSSAIGATSWDELKVSTADVIETAYVTDFPATIPLKTTPKPETFVIYENGVIIGQSDIDGKITGASLSGSLTGSSLSLDTTTEDPLTPPLDLSFKYTDSVAPAVVVGAGSVGNWITGTVNVSVVGEVVTAVYTPTSGLPVTATGVVGEDVDGGDFKVFVSAAPTPSSITVSLLNGSDGAEPTDLPPFSDYKAIDGVAIDWIFSLSLGLSADMLRKFLIASDGLKKFSIVGSPYVGKSAEFITWANALTGTYDYCTLKWTTEEYFIDTVKFPVCGSVTGFNPYANMFRNSGEIQYAPAGTRWGLLSGASFLSTDYDDNKQELVDARACYVVPSPRPMMWDQWTASSESDLHAMSYCNSALTVLLVERALRNVLISNLYEMETTGGGTGIDGIIITQCSTVLQEQLNKGFLTDYSITVEKIAPRTRKIVCPIQPAEDVEIYELEIIV